MSKVIQEEEQHQLLTAVFNQAGSWSMPSKCKAGEIFPPLSSKKRGGVFPSPTFNLSLEFITKFHILFAPDSSSLS